MKVFIGKWGEWDVTVHRSCEYPVYILTAYGPGENLCLPFENWDIALYVATKLCTPPVRKFRAVFAALLLGTLTFLSIFVPMTIGTGPGKFLGTLLIGSAAVIYRFQLTNSERFYLWLRGINQKPYTIMPVDGVLRRHPTNFTNG